MGSISLLEFSSKLCEIISYRLLLEGLLFSKSDSIVLSNLDCIELPESAHIGDN